MKKPDVIVWGLMLAMVVIGGTYSLVAPFYPKEAEKKGMTSTQYGFVFGVFELCGFLFSAPLGLFINKIGVKLMMTGSMIILFVSTSMFGLLNYINNYTAFFSLSILLRILGAIGQNGLNVSVYAVINEYYQERSYYLIGLTEMYYAFGLVIAPLYGSVLFSAGGGEEGVPFGYNLPFLVTAGIIISIGVLLQVKVPSKFEKAIAKSSKLSILTYPGIWAGFFAAGSANLGLATFSSMLEPHLRIFDLSVIEVGLLFLLNGMGYCFMCPVSGKLCDKGYNPGHIIICGTFTAAIGSMLIGPVSFLNMEASLPLIISGLVLHGFGLGMVPMPAYLYMKKQFQSSEFEHIVSGLFLSGFFLGGFIGPTVGGHLYEASGGNFGEVSLLVFVPYVCVTLGIFALEVRNSITGNTSPRPQPEEIERERTISSIGGIPYLKSSNIYQSVVSLDAETGQELSKLNQPDA